MGNIPPQLLPQEAAAGASPTTPVATPSSAQPQGEGEGPTPDQDRKDGNVIKIDDPKVWNEKYGNLVKKPGENTLTVVEFAAQWCGPSRFIAPFIEKLAEVHKDVKFLHLSFDKMEEVASGLGVDVVPTFLLYKRGEEKKKIVGARRWELSNEIQKYKNE